MKIIVEIAVDSLTDAVAAANAGADRIELCAALDQDGLTPSLEMLRQVKSEIRIPVVAMARPRAGDFDYSAADIQRTADDSAALVDAGADGLVFGALRADSTIDSDACRLLLDRCEGRESVFHRAFDRTPDPLAALDVLIQLGFTRVLTTGGTASAADGAASIARLIERAADRIEVLPGGGVRADNVAQLIRHTSCRQVHSSCRVAKTKEGVLKSAFDAGAVRALRSAVDILA